MDSLIHAATLYIWFSIIVGVVGAIGAVIIFVIVLRMFFTTNREIRMTRRSFEERRRNGRRF